MDIHFVRLKSLGTIRALRSALCRSGASPSREEVHSLRKLIRRVETILLVSGLSRNGTFPRLNNLAKIRGRAGAVRDMDELIKLVAALPVDQEEECLFKILAVLTQKREQRVRKLHRAVVRYGSSTRRDLKILSELLEKDSFLCKQDRLGTKVSRTVPFEHVSSVSEQLAAWPQFRGNNLHAFRLRVRELRSALQLFDHDSDGLVKLLGKVKDAIGEWHDWTVLASTAANIGCAAHSDVMRKIQGTVKRKYGFARMSANTMRKEILG